MGFTLGALLGPVHGCHDLCPPLVQLLVGTFPVASVTVLHSSCHTLVGDGVVTIVEDGKQSPEPVRSGTDERKQVGKAWEHEVLRETRVEGPNDFLCDLNGFEHRGEEGVGVVLHSITKGGAHLGWSDEGGTDARGVVTCTELNSKALVEGKSGSLGSCVFGHGRERSVSTGRRDSDHMSVVAGNHVWNELLSGDPVCKRVDAPQTSRRVEIDVEDGVARCNTGTVDENTDLLAAESLSDLLANLSDLFAVADIRLEVKNLGGARRSSKVGRWSHVKHSDMRLLLVTQELNDLLADALRATGDYDDVLGVVDGVASPLGVVSHITVDGTVDGTKENEDPDVANPIVLIEEKRLGEQKEVLVGSGERLRGVLLLMVENRKRR